MNHLPIGSLVKLIPGWGLDVPPRYKGAMFVKSVEKNYWANSRDPETNKWIYILARHTASGRVDTFGRVEGKNILPADFGKKVFKEYL